MLYQLIVLNFGNGDVARGFPSITAQLWEPGYPHPSKFTGYLPPDPELVTLYRQWHLLYTALYQRLDIHARIEVATTGVTNVSEVEFDSLCQHLCDRFNHWLHSDSFRTIDQRLRTKLDRSDDIQLIIETNDPILQRFPWHQWRFLEDYARAEIALSTLDYDRTLSVNSSVPETAIRILAVLGNSDGIDVEQDRTYLERLQDAKITFLVEPRLVELNEQLWNDWDVLFFAGHSSSYSSTSSLEAEEEGRGQGYLGINATEQLTIEQLRYALKRAITRGLKLAIFNSCDGLGLARSLADLHIPYVIVMREPVPDRVAHTFLKHFLTAFSSGQSLYAAIREARERLQGLEAHYPCASWLPVICQNPAEVPIHWHQWQSQGSHECAPLSQAAQVESLRHDPSSRLKRSRGTGSLQSKRLLRQIGLTSTLIAVLIFGLRFLGFLQPWELSAFDSLMRLRPWEVKDQRLLIVTITEDDFQLPEQQNRRGSLSDLALTRLLEKLTAGNPRIIGLDIYRDFPVETDHADLVRQMQDNSNLFVICKRSDRSLKQPDISPPPEVPPERHGFSDFVTDPDNTVRRHLLAMAPRPGTACATPYAFSARIVFQYLRAEGIAAQFTPAGTLQLGEVLVPRLRNHQGGYHTLDDRGYQLLLNYRSNRSPLASIPTVTLTQILRDQVALDDIQDRIVLIGVTAYSTGDYHATPYSARWKSFERMPGVMAQAQMISQLISAVKDNRPLLQVWPLWGDGLWIWGWAMVGSVTAWLLARQQTWIVGSGLLLGGAGLFCGWLLNQGIWAPLIPALLACAMAGYVTRILVRRTYSRRDRLY